MRPFRTILLMGFAVLLVSVFFNSSVIFGWEQPPGEPPYGLAIQGDAAGIRLSGVMVVEFLNYNPMTKIAQKASVVVRLRKGTELAAFFGTVPGPLSTSNPGDVQTKVMDVMSPLIIQGFPSLGTVILTLRYMDESIPVDGEYFYVKRGSTTYPLGTYYFVTDVEFAAK